MKSWNGDVSIIIHYTYAAPGRCMLHPGDRPTARAVVPLLITDKPITMLSDRRYLRADRVKGLCQFCLVVIWCGSAPRYSRVGIPYLDAFLPLLVILLSIVLALLMSPLSDQRDAPYAWIPRIRWCISLRVPRVHSLFLPLVAFISCDRRIIKISKLAITIFEKLLSIFFRNASL